jgi:hypothetical protein
MVKEVKLDSRYIRLSSFINLYHADIG